MVGAIKHSNGAIRHLVGAIRHSNGAIRHFVGAIRHSNGATKVVVMYCCKPWLVH